MKKNTEINRYTIKVSIGKNGKITHKKDVLACKKASKSVYWITDNDEYSSVYDLAVSDVGQMDVYEDEDGLEFEFAIHYFTDAELHKANLKKEAKKFIQKHTAKLKKQVILWNNKTSLSFFNKK